MKFPVAGKTPLAALTTALVLTFATGDAGVSGAGCCN